MYILGIHTKAGELDEIPLGFATSDDAIAYLDDRFEEVAYGGRVNMDGTKFTLLFAWPSNSDEWVEVRIIHIDEYNSRMAMYSDDKETRLLGRIANHIINEQPKQLYYYYMGKSDKILALENEQRRAS